MTMVVKRDGYMWKQTFSKGVATSKLKKVANLTKNDKTGTTVTFIPDVTVLSDIQIDLNRYLDFITLSSYMNKGLIFDFIGIDENGNKITKKIISKNGLYDLLDVLDSKYILKKPITISDKSEYDVVIKKKTKDSSGKVKYIEENTGKKNTMECEILIDFSKNDTGLIKSYCNGLETIEGGSHDVGCRMALTEVFTKAINEGNILTKKDGKIEIIKDDIQEGIVCIISINHSDAVYKSQTKDKVDMQEVQWFVKRVVVEQLQKWLKENQAQAKLIYQRIIAAAKGRLAANRAKNAKKKEAAGIINGLSSLDKILLATGDDPKNKRMFIVEGDSAGGGACEARCTTTDTIAKLRGKPLNTHDLPITKIEANKEWADIETALGCGMDENFDEAKLSHDMIIGMADADIDGTLL